MNVTKERSYLSPKQVRPYAMDAKTTTNTLDLLGISYNNAALKEMQSFYAMDADVAAVTTPSVSTPIQFLQHWLPDVVEVVTAAREIDAIVGRGAAKIIIQHVNLAYTSHWHAPLATSTPPVKGKCGV